LTAIPPFCKDLAKNSNLTPQKTASVAVAAATSSTSSRSTASF